jgi:hypothetical protein
MLGIGGGLGITTDDYTSSQTGQFLMVDSLKKNKNFFYDPGETHLLLTVALKQITHKIM